MPRRGNSAASGAGAGAHATERGLASSTCLTNGSSSLSSHGMNVYSVLGAGMERAGSGQGAGPPHGASIPEGPTGGAHA